VTGRLRADCIARPPGLQRARQSFKVPRSQPGHHLVPALCGCAVGHWWQAQNGHGHLKRDLRPVRPLHQHGQRLDQCVHAVHDGLVRLVDTALDGKVDQRAERVGRDHVVLGERGQVPQCGQAFRCLR